MTEPTHEPRHEHADPTGDTEGSKPTDRDYSLLSAFGDGLPGFAGVVGHDRPLLVAVGLSGLVLGGSCR